MVFAHILSEHLGNQLEHMWANNKSNKYKSKYLVPNSFLLTKLLLKYLLNYYWSNILVIYQDSFFLVHVQFSSSLEAWRNLCIEINLSGYLLIQQNFEWLCGRPPYYIDENTVVRKKMMLSFLLWFHVGNLMSQMSFSPVKGLSLKVRYMTSWLVAKNRAQMKLWEKPFELAVGTKIL